MKLIHQIYVVILHCDTEVLMYIVCIIAFARQATRRGLTATETGLVFGVFCLTLCVASPVFGKIVSDSCTPGHSVDNFVMMLPPVLCRSHRCVSVYISVWHLLSVCLSVCLPVCICVLPSIHRYTHRCWAQMTSFPVPYDAHLRPRAQQVHFVVARFNSVCFFVF